MKLNHGLHLAYCTNVHRGESWPETFAALERYTLAVREKVCPHGLFGIGLRLSERAAVELNEGHERILFQRWLEKHSCYVFTVNGFPYGQYHGLKGKEKAYRPDWTSPERVAYTNLLFNLLAEIVPPGIAGSVSTLPGTFKEFHVSPEAQKAIRQNIWQTVEHIARVSAKTGRQLYLGLEPEPLCQLESSAETIQLFEKFRAEHPRDDRLTEHLGVNYDTCHFAVEFDEPLNALPCLVNEGIKITKIQLSSALQVRPTVLACEMLERLSDDVFLHQVVERNHTGNRKIYRDLPDALAYAGRRLAEGGWEIPEWRMHFHVPLQSPPKAPFHNTNDHLLGALDLLGQFPEICSHLEMKTYTWDVLPWELKNQSVVEQLTQEYAWTLEQLKQRGLAR